MLPRVTSKRIIEPNGLAPAVKPRAIYLMGKDRTQIYRSEPYHSELGSE